MEKGPRALVFVGDVHRKIPALMQRIEQAHLHHATLVQVGDFGIGFGHTRTEAVWCAELNAHLRARDIYLYVLRGNHDDPAYFGPGTRLPSYSNLTFLRDSTLLRVCGEVILCVGGGISVDRTSRTRGSSYWEGEQVLYEPDLLDRLPLQDVTMVATHSSPQDAPPHGTKKTAEWWLQMGMDPRLAEDIVAERHALTQVWGHIREKGGAPHTWVYGHFHESAIEQCGDTLFRMLPELEMWMLPSPAWSSAGAESISLSLSSTAETMESAS